MATLSYPSFFVNYQNSSGFNWFSSIGSSSEYTLQTVIQPVLGQVVTINSQTVTGGDVSIIKSDNTTEVIFSSVSQALTCLETMHRNNQYYLQASDDIVVINISATKLLIAENTFIIQKL